MIMKRTSLLFASCALALAAAAVPARPVLSFQDENGTTHVVSEASNGVIEVPASTKSKDYILTFSSLGAAEMEYETSYFNALYSVYGTTPFVSETTSVKASSFTRVVTHGQDKSDTARNPMMGGRTYTIYGIDADGNRSEPLTFFLRVVATENMKDVVKSDNFSLDEVGTYSTVSGDFNAEHYIYSSATIAKNDAGEVVITSNEDVKSGFVVTKNSSELVIKKITIEWGSDVDVDEQLGVEIYGKKLEEYTSAADLYDEATQGQHLATIYCTGSTDEVTFDINSERDFIGLRAINGDVPIKSITAVWTYSIPDEPEITVEKIGTDTKITWTINGYGVLSPSIESGSVDFDWAGWMENQKTLSCTLPENQETATIFVYSQNIDSSWNETFIQHVYHYNVGSNGNVSGVEDVDADNDAEAEYYNLQGVRVAADDLVPGIYIRRLGTTVTKVAIR